MAKKMGHSVTAISSSKKNKEEESKNFGADHFLLMDKDIDLTKYKENFDFILNTVSGDIDWNTYMTFLKPLGVLCICGVPENEIKVKAGYFISDMKSIVGSFISGSRHMMEMLEFCSEFNIKPKLEIFQNVMSQLREKEGIVKIGVQGYCYGAKIAVVLSQGDLISGFVVAHPSLLELPDDIKPVKQPGLFLCAEIDRQFPAETRKKTEELLKAKGSEWKFVDYPGMKHGFAVRGNSADKSVADASADCVNKSTEFFKQILLN